MPADPPYLSRRTLLKQQRNAVYAWLTDTGWDHVAFEWREEERDGELVSRLAHRSSGYFCDFVHVGDMDYGVLFAPGDGAPDGQASASWSDLAAPVRAWLDGLRDEVEAPDLWTLLGREAVLAAGDQDDNAPLSGSEVRTVAERIELARAYLLESGLVSDQLAGANRKLDYLVAAAPRVGRFDWSNLAISVVIQIAITAAFGPDQAERLLETLLGPVRQLLGG